MVMFVNKPHKSNKSEKYPGTYIYIYINVHIFRYLSVYQYIMYKTRSRSVKDPSVLYCGIIILGSKPLLFYMLSCLSIRVIECLRRRYAAGKTVSI